MNSSKRTRPVSTPWGPSPFRPHTMFLQHCPPRVRRVARQLQMFNVRVRSRPSGERPCPSRARARAFGQRKRRGSFEVLSARHVPSSSWIDRGPLVNETQSVPCDQQLRTYFPITSFFCSRWPTPESLASPVCKHHQCKIASLCYAAPPLYLTFFSLIYLDFFSSYWGNNVACRCSNLEINEWSWLVFALRGEVIFLLVVVGLDGAMSGLAP